MKVSVITPSYNQLRWLKLCASSVADQEGVVVEYIIQDARSGKDLEDWVRANSPAKLYVESDSGMYDAINRGFLKATGDIVAWLNCDEQYLPGALAKVVEFFSSHPNVDVLFGDAVLLSEDGRLLSYRRAILPSLLHTRLAHLNTLSCATFVRRSVIERSYLLKPEWKAIADAVWVADMIKGKLRMAVLPEALAAFTLTQENLGQTSLAFKESQRWQEQTIQPWERALKAPVIALHRVRKFLSGAYALRDFATEIYTQSSGESRDRISSSNLSFTWARNPDAGGVWQVVWKTLCRFGTALLSSPQGVPSKGLPFRFYHPPRWPLALRVATPILLATIILYFEQQTGAAIIIAPMLSMVLMLLLSFFLEPLQLIPFALTFSAVVYCSIHYMQPFNTGSSTDWIRLILRMTGFCIAAALAVLFSKSRCEAKAHLDQTVEIITNMPVPVIISDALGTILFVNDEAVEFTGMNRGKLIGALYPRLFMGSHDEGSAMRDYIKFFQTAPVADSDMEQRCSTVCLTKADGEAHQVEARFICLGHGESRYMVTVFKV
jgi:PAS domain-containing protein